MIAYVITFMGGYYSAEQGRVRHINDAQLFSWKGPAQKVIDDMGEPFGETCDIIPVEITLLSTPE